MNKNLAAIIFAKAQIFYSLTSLINFEVHTEGNEIQISYAKDFFKGDYIIEIEKMPVSEETTVEEVEEFVNETFESAADIQRALLADLF